MEVWGSSAKMKVDRSFDFWPMSSCPMGLSQPQQGQAGAGAASKFTPFPLSTTKIAKVRLFCQIKCFNDGLPIRPRAAVPVQVCWDRDLDPWIGMKERRLRLCPSTNQIHHGRHCLITTSECHIPTAASRQDAKLLSAEFFLHLTSGVSYIQQCHHKLKSPYGSALHCIRKVYGAQGQ